jgi:hypothetical protein
MSPPLYSMQDYPGQIPYLLFLLFQTERIGGKS